MKKLFTILFVFFISQNILNAQVKADAGSDKEICLFDTLRLIGSGLPSGDTGTFSWYRISDNQKVSTNANYIVKMVTVKTETYQLVLTHTKNGITTDYFDTVSVRVNALPSFQSAAIPPRCYNDGAIYLTQSKYVTAYSGDLTQSETDIRYYQKFKNPSWISGGPVGVKPYIYDFPKHILNSNVPQLGLKDTICFEYRDYKGCYNTQCKPVRINPNPVVELKSGTFCQKSGPVTLDYLILKPFIKSGGISTFRCIELPPNSPLNKDSIIYQTKTNPSYFKLDIGDISTGDHSGDYKIEYCFKDALTGCQTCDTSVVSFVKIPKIGFRALPKLCVNSPLFNLDTMAYDTISKKNLTNAIWNCVEYNGSRNMSNPTVAYRILNSINNSNKFNSTLGSGSYYLKVSDSSSGCMVKDSLYVTVNGLPLVDINLVDTVCSNEKAVQLNNVQPSGNVGKWSGKGVSGKYFDATVSNRINRFESFKIKYEYTNPSTGCTSSDSENILVQTSLQIQINTYVRKTNNKYWMILTPSYSGFIDTNAHKLNWHFSDNSNASGWYPQYKESTDSGLYKIWMDVDYDKCSYIDSVEVMLDYKVTNTSVKSIIDSGLSYYPNPASSILHLNLDREGKIRIEDLTGKSVFEQEFDSGQFDVPISEITRGIYIISYTDSNGITYRFKLVKE